MRKTEAVTVVLVGATAVGKSTLAVRLAQRYRAAGRPAEVVNADSMLVYRGMDIGTAKPTVSEREGVPHHLLDVLEVHQTATVADFQVMARAAIADCRRRAVIPIVVGGSALYVRAVVDDFAFPGTDARVRGPLEDELARVGPAAMHARLAAADPASAAMIEPANGRRIVRALEVVELTGAPYRASLPEHRYLLPDVVQIGLRIDRPTLDERITRRVAAMWDAGFVDEVRRLAALRPGLRDGVTASRALGYRQLLAHLDGELTEAEAREQTVLGTRRFARRQGGWFPRDPRIGWLEWDRPDLVDAAATLAGPTGNGPASNGPGGRDPMED
ncbi:tRNA (adenosine(37)-N6)-dimethylallyltransferase MiaA [uncultured Friedmanniella sp.]|uniref:tRNA (adenosine(37)-N6)-dimethylallyltransferase MiaA n=1 Tax=uncultured Friedmanniella sp. TaxID=335381 RepID=UPI0035CA3242